MGVRTLKSNTGYKGYLHLVIDTILLNNKERTHEYLIQKETSCIVVVNHEGKLLLLHHYRHPIKKTTLEIPMGEIDSGETPEDAAKRELNEETGLMCSDLVSLASIHPSNGTTNQIMHLFFARLEGSENIRLCNDDGIVNSEFLEPNKALQSIMDGTITDAPTVTSILLAHQKKLI